ncbi:dihydroorotase [Microbacteriaceae bacterium MWH-Ta3]|nr:dihydroorotase [Microbacteriaceae bacterium MWH-Ta3]
MSTIIRKASIMGGDPADIRIEDGQIVAVGVNVGGADVEIDASGLIALPGLVDLHTHLREPGGESSETILSGSRAAAAGGFTAVHAMANTSPVADNANVVDYVYRKGLEAGYVEVRPVGAVTHNLAGESLADIGAMARSTAAVTVFSDDGKCVGDSLLMRRALEYVATFGGVIAQHAQDPRLTIDAQMNEGAMSAELGLAGWPRVAEEAIIARDVLLAEYTGARLHVCHLSTAGSVEVIRWAKQRGIQVTAEATPHHLLLTDDLAQNYNPLFKVNPPLRTRDDVEAVRRGVADGTIDIVATDHAPHGSATKDCTWSDASFGMVGLESALSIVQHALVDTGLIGWADVARIMSTTPARIGSVDGYDAPLTVGSLANITLVDPSATTVWGADKLAGRSTNTPFTGLTLPGRVVHTFFRGTHTVRDGSIVELSQAGNA